jgi:hypothetical protein
LLAEHEAGWQLDFAEAEALSAQLLLQFLGSQLGSQSFGSQELGLHFCTLHSVFAFFFAFFFPPPSIAAKEDPDKRATANKPKNIFFIFKYLE